MTLLVVALVLLVAGAASALALGRWPRASSAFAVLGAVAAAACGGAHAVLVLLGGPEATLTLPWHVPDGALRVGVDPLSAFFLLPIFVLSALSAIYGRSYMGARGSKAALAVSWFAFDMLVAGMVVVVVARQAVLFLVAWEVMSLSAYLLVTFEHDKYEVRRAGWVYLVATHVATAFLIAMFLLMARHAHSFDFDAFAGALHRDAAPASLFLALAMVGFGAKAGLVPLHVWLPEAHAAAPSHVSALMSGVLIKMGIYGLLRVITLIGPLDWWWGPVLMTVGLVGALLGIVLAAYQRDLKRALAYSSVENVGLVFVGLGTAFYGAASGMPHVAALGMFGALLHIYNHALVKGLLFLGAGSVLHGTGTKDLEQLGGVLRRMPRTGAAMVIGAVAIAALPPMNGFVSKWLLYLGVLEGALASGRGGIVALFVVGLVALVGALAVLAFVRLVGIALLGEPRSAGARDAHESPAAMTVPMGILAAASLAAALAPRVVAQACERVVAQLLEGAATNAASAPPRGIDAQSLPLVEVGAMNVLLALSVVLGAVLFWRARSTRAAARDATWACGYVQPSARMQYTGRSFAAWLTERLLPGPLRPRVVVNAPGRALFAGQASLASDCADPITRQIYEPFLARWGDRFARLRWLQQGVLQVYLLYIVAALSLGIAWVSLRAWVGR